MLKWLFRYSLPLWVLLLVYAVNLMLVHLKGQAISHDSSKLGKYTYVGFVFLPEPARVKDKNWVEFKAIENFHKKKGDSFNLKACFWHKHAPRMGSSVWVHG